MSTLTRKPLRVPGIRELVYRGRQEAEKWLERAMPASPRDVTWTGDSLEAAGERFFAGATDPAAPLLLRQWMRDSAHVVLATADRLRAGRFDLLGYRDLDFGVPPDWHLDPVHQRRAPLEHWSLINALDPEVVGDSKIVWELSRHQWIVTLAQAYRLTGEDAYAAAAARAIRSWLQANPPGLGINWASSLEAAFRLIAWSWVLMLLRGSAALTLRLQQELAEAISTHASHVARYLSYYFSPNTHLTGEALGLMYAAAVLPESRQATRWRELGRRILIEQCWRQILPDGVYFEQATCYHRYTADIYLHFAILERRRGADLPADVLARIESCVEALLTLCRPDGTLPQIGDADGGWLLPLANRGAEDSRGVLSTAAVVFERGDFAWAAGGLTPEIIWLFGAQGVRTLARLAPSAPRCAPSRLLPAGGYGVMRSSWQRDAHQLVFDVGPLGCPVSGGHGHADLLSIHVAPFGEPCIVDPGTGGYTESQGRAYFRGTRAHSTVLVDNRDQAMPAGPFSWNGRRPVARLHVWSVTPDGVLADASHDAYATDSAALRHRRRVLFVGAAYWIVVDDLLGAGTHDLEIRYQFARVEIVGGRGLSVRAIPPSGRGLWVQPMSAVSLDRRIEAGRWAPAAGWISPEYGQREPAPMLIYSARTALPARVVTLLTPAADLTAEMPDVEPLFAESTVAGVRFRRTGEQVTFEDRPAGLPSLD